MAWAQNLLGFCLFACASQTPFSWVWPGGLQVFSLFLVGSKSNVSAVFWLRFRMVWALFLSLFNGFQQRRFGIFPALRCALLDATFRNLFSLFLVGSKSNVSAVFWLRFRMVWALYFFLFSGFQKRRFGILLAAVSQWLRHKTYWGSAFSHARPKHLFLEFGLVTCRFSLCF